MKKKEIRKIFKAKRDAVTYAEKQKWDDLLLIQFQTLELPHLDHVMSFYPMEERNEVNTFLMTDYLHFRNPQLQISYPRTDAEDCSMKAIACQADSIFEANAFNTPEPTDNTEVEPQLLDLIIIPLLAFDEKGYRVGYGKGFYDRFLSRCKPGCIKVGVSWFPPIAAIEDKDEFDVPLDFCITPERVYVF